MTKYITTQCVKVIRLAFANLEQFSGPVMGPYFHPFLFRIKISSCHAVYKTCRCSSILGNYTLQVWYILDNTIKKLQAVQVFRMISLVTYQPGEIMPANHAHIITVSCS